MNNWSVSVLSSLSSDTEPSLVLVFDDAKYVFNAGENTNRAYLQSKQNWRKTRSIFTTSVGTQRCSGLAGIMMSFADAAIQKLDLVGPPGMTHFVAGMRMFSYRETMPLKTVEAPHEVDWSPSPEPLYKDSNLSVYSIPLTPGESSLPSSPTTTSLKRKRANSGSKPNVELIQRLMTNYRWSPSSLEGEDAQEYRRMMLDIMFGDRVRDAATQSSSDSSPQQAKKKGPKQQPKKVVNKAERSDELENYWQRPRPPPAYYKLLPTFEAPVKQTLAYIAVGPRVRGKFDVAKAEALGVQGRLRAQLTKGHAVTFEALVNGEKVQRTVQPEEVMGESEAPGVVIVLEVPTVDYIPSLSSAFENSPFYSRFRSKSPEDSKEYQVRGVFHICGPGVVEDERYQEFMAGFADSTEHVVSSPDHASDPITFTRASFNQLVLNRLDGDMFPVQQFSLEPKKVLPPKALPMDTGATIRMRPHTPFKRADLTDRFHTNVTSDTLDVPPETLELFKKAQEQVASMRGPETEGSDVKIIPLGTGSALPTIHRNVSSTLIQVPGWGNILFDAGEGTWGQLCRQFGKDGIEQALKDLRCIFISHIHADHHLGLAKILSKRRQLDETPRAPLYLVSNRSIHAYLREWSNLEDLGIEDTIEGNGVKSILSEALHWTDPTSYEVRVGGEERWVGFGQSKQLAQGLIKSLGLASFKTVSVEHRVRCYGAIIRHQDGWGISFSGDTIPTDNLVKAGLDSTVLIHEATMADDQAELAHAKAHSTFGQAIDVGKRMNAKHVLLTHFSARYPKMPPRVLRDGQPTSGPVVALAFDHVNYKIGTLWKMAVYREAIKQAFEDTAEEGEDEQLDAVVALEDGLQRQAA